MILGAATSPTTSPYVIAACIGAVPALLTATATWYSVHKGNKNNHADNQTVNNGVQSGLNVINERLAGFEADFKKTNAHFERIDLRFDSIEDKIERHLGWHRVEAATNIGIQDALLKESSHARPSAND